MDRLIELNRESWNLGSARYSAARHSEYMMQKVTSNPAYSFHNATWELLRRYVPELEGKRVCVPSSGDNHAVFAFAMMGASVTSCDISPNQLENARKAAEPYPWAGNIEYHCCDTRTLEGVDSSKYDLVYTSNGVHVWIDDLYAMYRSVCRVLKPGAVYVMYDIHPFQRPFDDNLHIQKPYDMTGPFDDDNEICFHWRVMDIINAMAGGGLSLLKVDEVLAEKDYELPFWFSYNDMVSGKPAPSREEVDRMYDWRQNPGAALPSFITIAAQKR